MSPETGAAAPPRAARVLQPLTSEELVRADRVAQRLHEEIQAFLAAFPPTARNASGLARHLGVDRTSCQRAVFAASRPYEGPEFFSRLPGVKGLRLLVEAAASSDPAPDRGVLDALVTAIDQFQDLIASTGGSMTRLTQRLVVGAASTTPGAPGAPAIARDTALGSRVQMFEAATALTGRSSDCWVAVYAYQPSRSDPKEVELYRANGLIGHVARGDAVPLVVHSFTTQKEDPTEPGERFASLEDLEVKGHSPSVVLSEFTSEPVPLVTSRQPHEFLVQSIDATSGAFGRPMDLMLASRTTMPHPAMQQLPIDEAWAMVNFPCRHMYFDVYLHRDLARACLPSLDSHLWGPDFAEHVQNRWQTRVADCPPLQLLGEGLRRPPAPAYPRLAELTEHLFDRVSLQSDEFVGFRCEVDYPLWRAGYCMRFDYSRPDTAGPGTDG